MMTRTEIPTRHFRWIGLAHAKQHTAPGNAGRCPSRPCASTETCSPTPSQRTGRRHGQTGHFSHAKVNRAPPGPDLPCPRTHRQRRLPTMPSKSSSQKNRTMWKRRTTRNPCEFTSCVIRHSNEARCLQYHERLSSFPSSHTLHTRRALVYSHSFPPKTPSPASQTNSGVS